ncbi:MAG: sensor domain-containing diguanylate cyclase [Nitrospirae bacterium]|nr:sensor domain-containing diguanylate cyclase [Nitrospirota bacterium]
MIKIFLIGSAGFTREIEDNLMGKGASTQRFRSVNSIKHRQEDAPDLLIIERSQSREPSFREFLNRYRETPKIVITDGPALAGMAPWMKTDLMHPLLTRSPRELEFAMKRILHEKHLAAENRILKTGLAGMKKELDFFEEVNRTLTSSLELGAVLRTIMKKTKTLVQAEACSILLIDEETGDLVFEKTTGKKETKKKIRRERLKIGEGIAGWVAREHVPVIVPDVSKDPRFNPRIDMETDFKTKSIMCVPIQNKGNILGVLEIVNKTNNEPFTKDDLALILRIVDHAAIAIERSSLYQKMAEMSVTDDLTKLFNTRYLNRTLEIELTRATRHHTSLSLIFMDVDHFKNINDNYGHLVGSKLLVEMGQLLLKSLRTVDIVARYGGDEFVMVLPQTSPKNALQIAERIRRSIEHNVFMKKDGYSFKVTASFGVASYPESAKSKDELMKLADEAMYRVKNQTRNGVYAIV